MTIVLVIIPLLTLTHCSESTEEKATQDKILTKVHRGPLDITINYIGSVVADKKETILNGLKYEVIIESGLAEGTLVEKGDTVVTFECKSLTDRIEHKEMQLTNQELSIKQKIINQTIQAKLAVTKLLKAKILKLSAEENIEKYKKLSKSQLAKAEYNIALQEQKRDRYIKKGGLYEKQLKDADTAIRMAKKRVVIEQRVLDFKINVNKDPNMGQPYSPTEIQDKTLQVEALSNNLEQLIRNKELFIKYDHPNKIRQNEENIKQAKTAYTILKDFTIPQAMRTLKSDLAEAVLALDRVQTQNKAKAKLNKFDIESQKNTIIKIKTKLNELYEEQKKLIVKAKAKGMILHRPGWVPGGGRQFEIKKGEELYQKAKLMEIPDMNTLMIKTKLKDRLNIHLKQSQDGKTKGTEATFVLDAFPNKLLKGRVFKASALASDTGTYWMKSGEKAYDVFIACDWDKAGLVPGKTLIPGMSCAVSLKLVHIENTLSIPVIALYSRNNSYYCKKVVDGKEVEQEITIGIANESQVQILSGLSEGDEVLLVCKNTNVENDAGAGAGAGAAGAGAGAGKDAGAAGGGAGAGAGGSAH